MSRDREHAAREAETTMESPGAASGEPSARPSTRGDFARYRVDGEIGRGGMGAVFKAWDFDLQRAVAMKVLHDRIAEDADHAARFLEEAQVAARLQHPAIVPVYDVGTSPDGKLYFTMKLVEGRTLSDVVKLARAGDLAVRDFTRFRLLETFREICEAIAYVHEHGIVHRDLKPNNVMIGGFGEVQVMDFGIAKRVGGQATEASLPRLLASRKRSLVSDGSTTPSRSETRAGAVLGTPEYMSPEQARGETTAAPSWDVFALGAILHFVLTGKAPCAAETRRASDDERPGGMAPPRSIDPTVPRELDAICMRALAPRSADRYPSAMALADDVQAFLEQRAVSALPEGPMRRAWRWARRQRRALAAVGVVIAIATGASIVSRASEARATLEQARSDASTASEQFASARAERDSGHHDPAAARAEHDRLLELGMRALETAQAWSALAPKDAAAQRSTFDAALALGDFAVRDQQWGLAASAYEQARATHVDDARAARSIDEVERARTRVADEHARTVAEIVQRAQDGKLDRDADYQDALFGVVSIGDAATTAALVRALGEVTDDLRAARRAYYLEAEAPNDDEKRRGEGPIDGLEAAVDALLATPPGEEPPASEPLRRATERLVARAIARAPKGTVAPPFRTLAGEAEEHKVGARALRVARLAAESLGRIGIADGAVDALERYLAAEDDELRAVPAAIALCRLGRPSSERALGVARDRLGTTNGLFWKLVGPEMKRFPPDEKEEPTTADGFLARAKSRALRGDNTGAIADDTRAIDLDPNRASSWLARGIARRKAGDVEGAIADYTRALAIDPTNPVVWNDRGFAELEHDDLDAAIADLEQSLKLRPASARTATHRATAYRLEGHTEIALAGYDAALKIDPRFELAYRGRAAAELDAGHAALAIADYDRAIALDGHDPEAWAGRALAKMAAKDLDGALADASRAVDFDPSSGPALIARAKVRRARGDAAGADDDVRRALSLELRPRDRAAALALSP